MADDDAWRPGDLSLLDAFEAWRAGEHPRAEAAFVDRLLVDPGSVDAWRGLGSLRWTQHRYDEALHAFEQALARAPHDPMHWVDVGLTLRDLGRSSAAIALFEVALRLEPGHVPALNELANALVDTGRPGHALPIYDQVVARVADREVYHHNRGVCLRLLGRIGEAVAELRTALALNPDYQWSRAELVRCGLLP